jgi:hypothetical protein
MIVGTLLLSITMNDLLCQGIEPRWPDLQTNAIPNELEFFFTKTYTCISLRYIK